MQKQFAYMQRSLRGGFFLGTFLGVMGGSYIDPEKIGEMTRVQLKQGIERHADASKIEAILSRCKSSTLGSKQVPQELYKNTLQFSLKKSLVCDNYQAWFTTALCVCRSYGDEESLRLLSKPLQTYVQPQNIAEKILLHGNKLTTSQVVRGIVNSSSVTSTARKAAYFLAFLDKDVDLQKIMPKSQLSLPFLQAFQGKSWVSMEKEWQNILTFHEKSKCLQFIADIYPMDQQSFTGYYEGDWNSVQAFLKSMLIKKGECAYAFAQPLHITAFADIVVTTQAE